MLQERSQEKLDLGRVGGRSKGFGGRAGRGGPGPAVWEQSPLMPSGCGQRRDQTALRPGQEASAPSLTL